MNKLDIIIVNYNSTEYLLKCLRSIYMSLNGDIAVKVYVVDNASKDNINLLQQKFSQVILSKNRMNIGFAKAVNHAISKTNAPNILLLNPDTIVDKNFFKSMLVFMGKNPDVGIAGPKIYENDGYIQGSARAFPTPMTALFGRNSFMTKFFPDNRLTRKNILNTTANGDTPLTVDWVSGACMMVRRTAIEDVGLMDENFFMYWEDADWCRRMIHKEWKVVYYPGASIVHFSGKSSDHNLIQSVVAFHKSAYYLFKKYYSDPFGIMRGFAMMGLGSRACFLLAIHGLRRWKRKKNKHYTPADNLKQAVEKNIKKIS
ncbi:glycosyltransferase family 2 protein [bacterium]|nr:glycosyltransferase family 2 protein [bacterium]